MTQRLARLQGLAAGLVTAAGQIAQIETHLGKARGLGPAILTVTQRRGAALLNEDECLRLYACAMSNMAARLASIEASLGARRPSTAAWPGVTAADPKEVDPLG